MTRTQWMLERGCFYRDLQSAGATRINYYDILIHTSFGAVRYGGPGQ
jgi:hypothetical protein